jgi:putative aminopeptidase FrvX
VNQPKSLTGKDKRVPKGENNRRLRRNLRRLAERKGISYKEAILKFYGVASYDELDKNLVYSLNKS